MAFKFNWEQAAKEAINGFLISGGNAVVAAVGAIHGGTQSKHGGEQTVPDEVMELYYSGKLTKYLPNRKYTGKESSDVILAAYEDYLKYLPKPMTGSDSSSTGSKSNDNVYDESAWDLWNTLHGVSYENEEISEGIQGVIVNTPAAYLAATNAGILPTQEETNPYILTIDQNSGKQDYTALKKLGVSWVCIDMGCYFNALHQVNASFRQPRLESQIKAATESKIPYGLFTTLRARTVEEAKSELSQISLTVRRYPPSMGLWLKLGLSGSQTFNTTLLNYYMEKFEELGLLNQVGLYVTKAQLKTIHWSKVYNAYYLWINEHIANVDDIPVPLDPQFFMCREVS